MKLSSLQRFFILLFSVWILLLANQSHAQTSNDLFQTIAQADEAVTQTNLIEAERRYRQIAYDYPTNTEGWLALAKFFYDQKRFSDALFNVRAASLIDPTNADIQSKLGDCYFALGEFMDAETRYRKALQYQPSDPDRANFWLGATLLNLARYPEAAAEIRKVPAYAAPVESWDNVARVFQNLTDYQDALYCYLNELTLKSHTPAVWRSVKECELALAAKGYRQPNEINSTNFEAHFVRAKNLMFIGQFGNAAAEFESALKSDPNGPRKITARVYFLLLTAPYFKTYQKHPTTHPPAVCLLLLGYFLFLLFLFMVSFRRTASDRPSWWLTLGWLLICEETYFAWIFLMAFFAPMLADQRFFFDFNFSALAVMAAAFFAFPNQPWGTAFQRLRSVPWRVVGCAGIGLVLTFAIFLLYPWAFHKIFHSWLPDQNNVALIQHILEISPPLAIAMVAVIGPIAEEILFRGLLFGLLEKRCEKWTILWTALAFAAFHGDLYYFLPLTCLGIVLGWVRQKSGSVWVSAILHGLNNLIALAAVCFSRHPH